LKFKKHRSSLVPFDLLLFYLHYHLFILQL
jgi:hypothetical protein